MNLSKSMQNRTRLVVSSLAVGLLSLSGSARGDSVTYDVATTQSYSGTVSGTLTGSGSSLTSFDLVSKAANGTTYTFDSALAGDSGSLQAEGYLGFPYTTSSGTPVSEFNLYDTAGDQFIIAVTGDFTSGFTYVGGQSAYYQGSDIGTYTAADTYDANFDPLTADNISLTAEVPPPPTVPEPSSLLLLATGVAGCVGTFRRRLLTR